MPDSYIQVAPDSTGKKLRTFQRVVDGQTVEMQYILQGGYPTFWLSTPSNALVAPTTLIDIFNAAGSGVSLKIRKLFFQQVYVATTGTNVSFDIVKTSAVGTGGTAVVPRSADSTDPALPAGVTARAVPTGGATNNFVYTTVGTLFGEETDIPSRAAWGINALAEGNELKELTLNEGEGFAVKKTVGAVTTSGTWQLLVVMSVQ